MSEHRSGEDLPEVWGGLEGTINRVHERYFDQCDRNGHYTRDEDLDRFASLGIKALRYPVLWERIAPDGLRSADWTFPDRRLPRLRDLGVRPIVGLVHHGSGPRDTSLVDSKFPARVARYARAVAERYPWLTDFTPINEPLTTARFSGLYGHWYPHGRDYATFVHALLNQCRAVVESMRAIRGVIPGARLVQTDDMGHTYSTPLLAYQAEFENHRRWLSFDLLCGRVDLDHPMWPMLQSGGATEADLEYFQQFATPPDVVGLNYYLTSDRFLDERLERYPEWSHGGNERHAYADIESVRVVTDGVSGHRALLAAAWRRYGLPVAFTEVHLGCTREEQLRWILEAWEAATELRAAGADVRAITIWSLLGAFDWNSLVTREANFYEPGAFDCRAPTPRPTAIAHLTRELATRGTADHPTLSHIGWWRRGDRFFYPQVTTGQGPPEATPAPAKIRQSIKERPVLIVGANGTLGRAFARVCRVRGIHHHLLNRQQLDIASAESVDAAFDRWAPWAVVNAAGYVRVDDAELDRERCFRENAVGPRLLAAACARRGARLVTFSTDLVFDGALSRPYRESDPTRPLNVYGESKAQAEREVLSLLPDALVVRTGAFFGPWDPHNFVHLVLRSLARGEPFHAAEDVVVSPTYVPDLVQACLDHLFDGERGIWHLTSDGEISWADLARKAAELKGEDPALVHGQRAHEMGWSAPRPKFSALTSERGRVMPALENALERFLQERDDALEAAEQGPSRVVCGVCGGALNASDGDGRCRLHRERGDGGVAAGG